RCGSDRRQSTARSFAQTRGLVDDGYAHSSPPRSRDSDRVPGVNQELRAVPETVAENFSGRRSTRRALRVWFTEAKDQQSEYQYVVESQRSGSVADFAYRKTLCGLSEWKRLDQR